MSVNFYDAMWENAYVIGDDGEMTSKLLIFSHFNGIYVEDEYRDGRPRYVSWGGVSTADLPMCQFHFLFAHRHASSSYNFQGTSK